MLKSTIKTLETVKYLFLSVICFVILSCNKESTSINLPAYGPDQEFYALSNDNTLTVYNAEDVRTAGPSITLTGLAASEKLVAIDFRPATGELYGVSNQSRLYIINTSAGTTKVVSTTALSPLLTGTITNIDFNPVADLLRIVTNTGQNLRVNPETGQVVGTDTGISNLNISGIAYSNNYAGATSTVLYDIDPVGKRLLQQNPPNDGTLSAIGNLDVDLGVRSTFDISPNGGHALLVGKIADSTKLYVLNLTNGRTELAGKFVKNTDIRSIAIPTAPVAYAVTPAGNFLIFNLGLATPEIYSKSITGLQTGETVIGMDIDPITGRLYALGSSSRLYTVNTATATFTQVGTGTFNVALNGNSFGFDFNPNTGKIRVVSDTRQNLEIDAVTAEVTVGTVVSPATAMLSAAAFSNNFRTTTATTLYVIDHETDKLYSLLSNTGVLTEIGALNFNVTGVNGFDISSSNAAYAMMTVGTKTGLYNVNIATGLSTLQFEVNTAITAFALGLRP